MQFIVKRDILLKSLNFVQGVVEKKNTLPILSNVLLQIKDKKLCIIATDLDIVFYDEIEEIKILKEADYYFINELKKSNLYNDIWQAYAALLPVKTVGVMGDNRTYEHICLLRAIKKEK